MGLIFLKYISDAFEELYATLKAGEGEYAGADPEDKDEYKAENVFFVPQDARWSHLQAHAKQPTIGKTVDKAMDAIEKENTSLKGVLPKVYARQNLDPTSLGELIDLIRNIALGDAKSRSADVLGHVFEQMAETLFRQWFVIDAREDWEEKPLSFFGDIVCGKTPSKKKPEYYQGKIPFIKIPDMHGNSYVFNTTDTLTEEGSNSQKNKLLPLKSICVSCIATVGLVSLTTKNSHTNQQINSIVPHKNE